MGEEIKISVVIPTYNSSAYICKTLESVYKQTKLPYEIVIVDDGSKDQTVTVIQKYIRQHVKIFDNVRIYQQENKGAGAARNYAISKAAGNWISFLDSDDIWDCRKIEFVEDAIVKNPDVSMVTHNKYIVDERHPDSKKLSDVSEYYDKTEPLFVQLYRGNFLATSCMTIKKCLVQKAGGFDETLLSAQDYDLWLKIARHGRIFVIERPLEYYMVRQDNISANVYRRYLCEMRICKRYLPALRKMYGRKKAARLAAVRVLFIHRCELYLALKNRKFVMFLKILVHFMPQCLSVVLSG